jgi:uncharacterized protein
MSDLYNGLRQRLEQEGGWPKIYLFKFIIPNNNHTLAQTEALFGPESQVSLTQSKTGKYISVTAKELMISADEVIRRYEKSSEIAGLMAL